MKWISEPHRGWPARTTFANAMLGGPDLSQWYKGQNTTFRLSNVERSSLSGGTVIRAEDWKEVGHQLQERHENNLLQFLELKGEKAEFEKSMKEKSLVP